MRVKTGFVFLALSMLAAALVHAQSFTEDEAVERVFACSSSIRYEMSSQAAREAAFALGIRSMFPSVSLSYDDSSSINMDAADSRNKTMAITLQQPLYDGGNASRARTLAGLEIALSRDQLKSQLVALERGVRSLFNSILVAQRKRAIISETIMLASGGLEIIKAELRMGIATELDVADAELEKLELELELGQTDLEIAEQLFKMRSYLVLEPASILVLVGDVPTGRRRLRMSTGPGELFGQAVAVSQELRSQRVAIDKAALALRSAQRAFLPTVELELAASVSGEDFPLANPNISGKLLLSFAVPEMPSSVSGSASSRVSKSRGASTSLSAAPFESIAAWIDRRSAMLNFEAETRKLEEMMDALRFNVDRQRERFEALGKQYELMEKRLELQKHRDGIVQKRLAIGEVKMIDRLKGAIELARTEIALGEAALELLESERDWEALLGLDTRGLERFFPPEGEH